MAYIYFKCSCKKSLAVDERGVGRTIKCVDCGGPVMVPDWEYEFACPKCDTTFGAASHIADDRAQCVVCGNEFVVPSHPPEPHGLDHDKAGEPADGVADEPQLSEPDDEPKSSLPPMVPSRKWFSPAINWARLQFVICRLTVVVVVLFIGVTGSSWFISKVIQSNAGLDLEIERSQKQEDMPAAIAILESAIKQYPLAFSRASRAQKLLAEIQARLRDTTNLAAVIALTKADKDSVRAANLLTKAIRKYPRATNRVEAEALVKTIQAQLNDSWMLSTALANALMTEDVSGRIELLEKTLTACPCATNRADAEAMIVTARRQLQETEGLDHAIQQAQREKDPSVRTKLLAEALAKYPKATNRDAALGLLTKLQTLAGGQVKDPLLKAIVSAREEGSFVAAIQVLTEALKINKNSPYRVEAEQVLAVYQKQLLETTAEQRAAVTDYIEGATDALANSGYVFLPMNKAAVSSGGALSLYDSPLANKIVAMNYGVEVRLRKLTGQGEKDGSGNPLPADSMRYVPRLILSAKNGTIPRGSIVVVEYYLDDYQDKAEGQRATVERIPFPTIPKGGALAVDCRGIECSQPKKNSVLKKEPGNKLYGIIVSVYGKGSELLLQKCSMARLLKECSLQTY